MIAVHGAAEMSGGLWHGFLHISGLEIVARQFPAE